MNEIVYDASSNDEWVLSRLFLIRHWERDEFELMTYSDIMLKSMMMNLSKLVKVNIHAI